MNRITSQRAPAGAGLALSLSLALTTPALAQTGPPAASTLDDISACSLEGDSVFIVTGRDAAARRYKYPWDAAVDALCNGKGFAIGTPAKAAGAARPAAAAAPALGATPLPTGAAAAPVDFPAEAQTLGADALAQRVSGRKFDVELPSGVRWRLEYKANGYLFVNTSTGGAVSGPWRTEHGRLCSHMRGASPSCNEVREQGSRLYLKRDNGEMIVLNPV
jgi:hypothetical protein